MNILVVDVLKSYVVGCISGGSQEIEDRIINYVSLEQLEAFKSSLQDLGLKVVSCEEYVPPVVEEEFVPPLEMDSDDISYCSVRHEFDDVKLLSASDAKRLSNDITKRIFGLIDNLTATFISIGYNLWFVREHNLYLYLTKSNNAPIISIFDYADCFFGFLRASTYKYIAVFERFCQRDSSDKPIPHIDSKFEKYNYTQLSLMVNLPDDIIAKLSYKMSIREMQSIIKCQKSEKGALVPKAAVPYSFDNPLIYDGFLDAKHWDSVQQRLHDLLDTGYKINIMIVPND